MPGTHWYPVFPAATVLASGITLRAIATTGSGGFGLSRGDSATSAVRMCASWSNVGELARIARGIVPGKYSAASAGEVDVMNGLQKIWCNIAVHAKQSVVC